VANARGAEGQGVIAAERGLTPATQDVQITHAATCRRAGGEVAGGDSYGSRWCERQRATTGYLCDVRISTPAGVAEGSVSVDTLVKLRDPSRGRNLNAYRYRWSLA